MKRKLCETCETGRQNLKSNPDYCPHTNQIVFLKDNPGGGFYCPRYKRISDDIDIKEAIEYLSDPIGKKIDIHEKAVKMAISALEKQIPKEPVMSNGVYDPHIDGEMKCPSCPAYDEPTYSLNFCNFCGQKLKEVESDE